MRRANGFTLVEAVTALAVAALLTTLAVPAFLGQRKAAGAAAEVQKLASVLARARLEAVRRNRVVTLCKSGNGVDCGGSWSQGWLLFVDRDGDGARDAGEPRLTVGRPAAGYRLRLSAFGSSSRMRFSPVGFTLAGNGTFGVCPADGDLRYARAVIVNKSGRVRFSADRDGDGIHEDASGRPLSCP